jgi:CheY-like chemotaxis protein
MKTNERILLVEDEAVVRAYLVEALTFFGFEVVAEADGYDALERCEAETFDLVLTDHMMPSLGGLGLVQGLRARNFGGRIYVLSGALRPVDRERYEELKVDGIALKPIHLRDLPQFLAAKIKI